MNNAKSLQALSYMLAAACASTAYAQQAAQPPAAGATDTPIEEVVVTGSRIRQDEKGFANPVTSFSADAIVQSGKTNLADFLAESPALLGSTTGNLTAGSNYEFGEVGLNLLDHRGLSHIEWTPLYTQEPFVTLTILSAR